jgi:uroporphyrinogen III methyltransferase / synthase
VSSRGFVYLVGAGPGDPRLLTLRAYELLRSAEVLAHDELVTDAVLALAPPEAEVLPVGRRHGHGKASYRLHPAVLERARAGKTVVRLKSGDPLVFGRGGEEAEELAESGIPFEIVPGVSAAVGAAAYAGIPLTHRQHSSAVTFATGHLADDAQAAPGETVVLFMAARRMAENLARLQARGFPSSTLAAYVSWATTPSQRVIVGTLADLPDRTAQADPLAPALVIVGDVVGLRERIAWFDRQPLRGRRVLVARARPGRSGIARELRALGAEVLELPEVSALPTDDPASLRAALARRAEFDGIVLGCAAGVDAAGDRAAELGLAIIAVGREAEVALRRRGVLPAIVARGACRDALEVHADRIRGRRLLLVASESGRPNLRVELAALGASVEVVAAYRHVHRFPAGRPPPIDLVILPSSSAARAVLGNGVGGWLQGLPMIAMGPRTEAEARGLGAVRVVRALEDTVSSLISRALSELSTGGGP